MAEFVIRLMLLLILVLAGCAPDIIPPPLPPPVDIIPPPLPPPVLELPASGATVDSSSPLLKWKPSTKTASYGVQIATDATVTSLVVDVTRLTTASYPVPPGKLNYNTVYYWRVNASSAVGTSSWSEVWNFKTPLPPPPPPALKSPLIGAESDSLSPLLKWQPSIEATSYGVQVGTNPRFSPLVLSSSTTDTYFDISSGILSYDTVYYWRVNASSAVGTSSWSEVWNFKTPLPVLESPSSGATVDSSSPLLKWKPSTKTASYGVQIATDATVTSLVVDVTRLTTASYPVPPGKLNYNTVYYWRVNASDIQGTSSWSKVWTFRTPLPPPVLELPASGATVTSLSPILKWQPTIEATSHGVQVATDSDFNYLVVIATILISGRTYFDIPSGILSYNTVYYWRVKASNIRGASPWSEVWRFRTPLR